MRRRIRGLCASAPLALLPITALGLSGSRLFAAEPPAQASQTAPADSAPTILFAGTALPVPAPSRAPYRDPADGILYVAPQSLAPLGGTYMLDERVGKATFVGPDGAVTITVNYRTAPDGIARSGVFVPANDVIEGLGGKCEWYPAKNTLQVRAVLTSVEMLGGQLRIKATLPVLPVITDNNGGRQIIVDISGTERGDLPKILDLQSPLVSQARVGQFSDDSARIVLDMKQPYAFSVLGGKPSLTVVLNPTISADAFTMAKAAAAAENAPPSVKAVTRKGASAPVGIVSGVAFHKTSDEDAQFIISADRVPSLRAALSKGRLTLDLLNTTLASNIGALANFDHPFLKAVHLLANGPSATQLIVDLTRAVVYTVRPGSKGAVEVDLSLPRGAVGKLAGKTIVVDPGHGGHDSGAPGVNGTMEKNVNLAIATQLTAELRDAGANVILTRSTDYFIPVDERPVIANRAGADFFISIHADSSDHNHSVTGSTVYYHFNQPSCKTLAGCIADRLADIGDIRSKGVGSDGIRFPGVGYGVLRGSQMVAVLVECGYMTSSADVRHLNDSATQKKTARAIVGGLRDYIEGNPATDTRNVNPQPDHGTNVPPLPTLLDADGNPSASSSAPGSSTVPGTTAPLPALPDSSGSGGPLPIPPANGGNGNGGTQ